MRHYVTLLLDANIDCVYVKELFLLFQTLKIYRVPTPEPCRGLKEETDLPSPAPGKEEIASSARDAVEPGLVESLILISNNIISRDTPG